jgi:hypothetical protein
MSRKFEVWEFSNAPEFAPSQGVVSIRTYPSRPQAVEAMGNLRELAPAGRHYQVREAS